MVSEAIARSEFELAHDLAWRAVQVGPRNDTALMYQLARAQSLSGRPGDSLVMLRRLAALGFRTAEVETHDDFRRVRSLPGWTEASALMRDDVPEPVAPAAPESASADIPAVPAVPAAPSAPLTPAAATDAASPEVPSAPAAPGLPIPTVPLALAYDSVSDRFVVVDEASDTLKIVDERTGRVIDLVSRGWSGAHRVTTVTIDPRRGELWAAGVDSSTGIPQSTVFKLQLVSGRLLQTIPLPTDAGPTRIIDLAAGREAIFMLDASGRRIFSLAAGGKSARVASNLVGVGEPISLAAASDSIIYVAHANGLARIDLSAAARVPTPVLAAADLGEIESISWHAGSLFAIQRSGDRHVAARIRLDARGNTVRAVEPLGPAAARAAAVYGGVFYYVVHDADRGMVLRGTRPK